MKLERLLEGVDTVRVEGDVTAEITGVVADTRRAGRGDIFVALRGHRRDGHEFAPMAYERGVRVFLLERPVDLPCDVTVIFSKTPRKTSAELLKRLYRFDKGEALFVGITGTKGKSSVAFLLGKMLNEVGVKAAVIGTLGISFLGENEPVPNTTPDLFFLIPRLTRLLRLGARVIIFECSSQALADGRLDGLSFDIGIFTSLSPDHIGTGEHINFAAYREAKRRLFTDFSVRHAVLNADDRDADFMSRGVPHVTKCSLYDKECDLYPTGVSYHTDGTNFFLFEKSVHTALLGEYNLLNTLLSLAAARKITGLPYDSFFSSLENVAIPGRFERIFHRGRLFIIDFAHNAESLTRLCRTVREIYSRPILLVFGSVGERSEVRRIPLARAAEAYADFSVITADDPGREALFKILAELHGAFLDKARAVTVPDRTEAIRHAFRISREGDIILLAGKGHERHQRIGDEKLPFCEREIIEGL